MTHQSSTSTVSPISLSPDVERRIEDPEVRRVLLLFIKLGQTDIIECLNEKVKQDPEEFKKILEAVCLYVRRGLKTQRYFTKQMRTDDPPEYWEYDLKEDKSITPVEGQLIDKFGARWPTVRGAIDMFDHILKYRVHEDSRRSSSKRLRYHVWTTVTICPVKDPSDQNRAGTESHTFIKNLRPQFVIYYPGLVNLAFLRQDEAHELIQESIFCGRWRRNRDFVEKFMEEMRKVIIGGTFEDGYTNHDGNLSEKKLPEKQRLMLAEFDDHNHVLVYACHIFDRKLSYVGGWSKYGNTWRPANPIGSILNASGLMADEFVGSHNLVKGCDEDSAQRAVKKYGIGYVPRPLPEIPSKDAGKDAGKDKEKGGRLRQMFRKEPKEKPSTRNSRDRGSLQTRTGSHGQQRQESNSKRAEEKPPAKKLESSDKTKVHPPGHSLTRAKLLPREGVSKAEQEPPAKKSSKKPAAQAVPSSSHTSGSGATSRR